MNRHLTGLEIENLLLRGRSALSDIQAAHLDSCEMCKTLFKEQTTSDQMLQKLVPLKSPVSVYEQILKRIDEQRNNPETDKKKDWFFVFSLGMLVLTLFVVIFQNPLPEYLTIPLKEITNSFVKSIEPITQVFTKQPMPRQNTNNLTFPGGFYIILIGLISVLFYFIMDNILNKRILR